MKIEDIKDEDSLEDWLQEQDSYEISVTIAARAAMRVQPWLWEGLSPTRQDVKFMSLAFYRSVLTSAVAAVYRTDDLKSSAFSAANVAAALSAANAAAAFAA
ncbi:MAG: hypothetical protein AAGF94_15055, partial [Pseudomonadota bacterium]